jgi:hypothetical protein
MRGFKSTLNPSFLWCVFKIQFLKIDVIVEKGCQEEIRLKPMNFMSGGVAAGRRPALRVPCEDTA